MKTFNMREQDRHSGMLLSGIDKRRFWISTFAGMTFLLCLICSSLFAETRAFPVPFVPKDGHITITFTDLPGSGRIQIFTIDGEEVTSLPIGPGVLSMAWDVTNSSGEKLASGVYLYQIGDIKGKLVVVR